jgi:hypothetical protein
MPLFIALVVLIAALYGLLVISRSKPRTTLVSIDQIQKILTYLNLVRIVTLSTVGIYFVAIVWPKAIPPLLLVSVSALSQIVAVYLLGKSIDVPYLFVRLLLCLIPTLCLINLVAIMQQVSALFKAANQSPDPTLASGTSRAMHEPRHH